MIIPIELRFKVDKDSKSAFRTNKTIKSHDVNSIEFHITIEGLELTDNYTAKILSIFHTSKSQVNMDCEIVEGKIIYKPDTNLISRHEHVTNYVYVYHNNQSLDVREFIYVVDLSKIDETSLEVKEVYDQSYADLLADFEQALNDYKDNLPQADSVRAEIDVVLNQFEVDSQAKLSQYDTTAQQVITDNQTAFNLAESVRQDEFDTSQSERQESYDQFQSLINEAESSRVQAEGQRESAESSRVSAETVRVMSESERENTEGSRERSEGERKANEEARELAEDERENAEVQRKTDHANRSAELAGKADKVVLKNLVENGDFSINEISSNFIISTSLQESATINDGKLVLKPKTFAWNNNITIDFPKNIGDIIYCRFTIDSPIATHVDWRAGGVARETPYGPGESTISFVNTVSSDASYMYLYTQDFTEDMLIKLDNVKAINLTQTFGAGNEPTKDEMDELIKVTGYIDDEYTLNNKEMLGYLMREFSDKHTTEWITPTLLNGVTGEVRYRINAVNQLELAGAISVPTDFKYTQQIFTFIDKSYIPLRISHSDTSNLYADRCMKFRIPIDGDDSVLCSISRYNDSFYVGSYAPGKRLHINLVVPLF